MALQLSRDILLFNDVLCKSNDKVFFFTVPSCNIHTDNVSYYCSVNEAFQYKQSQVFQPPIPSYNGKLSITMGKKKWTEQMLFRIQLDIQMDVAITLSQP